jgi:Cu/Ag efflux protein CusF
MSKFHIFGPAKEEIVKIFHETYEKSCAKHDINALKTQIKELTEKIHKLENPTKKLTKKQQKIKNLELKISNLEYNLSYVDKHQIRHFKESDELIRLKYELMQLRKKK